MRWTLEEFQDWLKKAKPKEQTNKYNAQKTTVNGVTFASKREATRYGELCLLFKAKKIFDLEIHPKFVLIVAGRTVGHYTADFAYREIRDGKLVKVVEEVKGFKVRDYPLRKNVFLALYPGLCFSEIK